MSASDVHPRPFPPGWSRLLLGDWTPVIRDPIDLLRLTFLAGAVFEGITADWNSALRLFVTFLATVVARQLQLPRVFDLAFVVGMAFQGWGNVFHLFTDWSAYDKIVHFVLPAAVAPLLYILLARLEAVPDLSEDVRRHQHVGILIVSFALGFAFGTLYEIYEYAAVKGLGADLQIGYSDTIGDLLDDAVGSLAGGALLVVWADRGWSTIRRVPAKRIEQGPPNGVGASAGSRG